MSPLLRVESLSTAVRTPGGVVRVVDEVSFEIARGETFALLGESGCGKSMTALSLLRLLPSASAQVSGGRVLLEGRDLLALPDAQLRDVRGRRVAMIFQDPMSSLNPVLDIGSQIGESLRRHHGLRGRAQRARTIELLEAVGIADAGRRCHAFPHQLSGGMKQRVMIAIALAGEPDLLIADEPTTALDVTIQAQVLELLRELQRSRGMALLLITHDLGVVAQMADRVAVMYAGQIVEQAPRADFFAQPLHPYSRRLFQALPEASARGHALAVIPGTVPPAGTSFAGCRFAARCDRAWSECHARAPEWTQPSTGHAVRCHLSASAAVADARADGDSAIVVNGGDGAGAAAHTTLLEVRDLYVHFSAAGGLLRGSKRTVHAVDGVNLRVERARTLALVGESGCGKTTVGRGILQLVRPTAGTVTFEGMDLARLPAAQLRASRAHLQVVFQDAYASMNPRMRVETIVEEGMCVQGQGTRAERRATVARLFEQVGLDAALARRFPHQLSGGQRQRVCIARALALQPRLIVCDEPTSALDVSVQAQILNLLQDLQQRLGVAYLFISHNLAVVGHLAHEVAVMYLGRIVEQGTAEEVLGAPLHPYTRALLASVPRVDGVRTEQSRVAAAGELPSPAAPPTGCHYHPRCAHANARCRSAYPARTRVSATHATHCFLYE